MAETGHESAAGMNCARLGYEMQMRRDWWERTAVVGSSLLVLEGWASVLSVAGVLGVLLGLIVVMIGLTLVVRLC